MFKRFKLFPRVNKKRCSCLHWESITSCLYNRVVYIISDYSLLYRVIRVKVKSGWMWISNEPPTSGLWYTWREVIHLSEEFSANQKPEIFSEGRGDEVKVLCFGSWFVLIQTGSTVLPFCLRLIGFRLKHVTLQRRVRTSGALLCCSRLRQWKSSWRLCGFLFY